MQHSFENGIAGNLAASLDAAELQSVADLREWPAARHMLAHIHNDNLEDARMLYKRLPGQSQRAPDVAAAFYVLQTLWQKDYQNIFTALRQYQWAPDLQPLADGIEAKVRLKILDLLSRAYCSIKVPKAAALLGISTTDVVKLVESRGWELDEQQNAFRVHRQPSPPHELTTPDQIQRLTECASLQDAL